MDRDSIAYQLMEKDNWDIVDNMDNFLYIYDHMPPRMKVVVDLRMTGNSVQEIAKMMKISPDGVYDHLEKAKKRLLSSIF